MVPVLVVVETLVDVAPPFTVVVVVDLETSWENAAVVTRAMLRNKTVGFMYMDFVARPELDRARQ
jgi:hypothetical protein